MQAKEARNIMDNLLEAHLKLKSPPQIPSRTKSQVTIRYGPLQDYLTEIAIMQYMGKRSLFELT